MPSVKDIPEQISHLLFNLIANEIIKIKKANGSILSPKENQIIKRNLLLDQYKKSLNDRLINYELNSFTREFFKQTPINKYNQEKKQEGRVSIHLKEGNKVEFVD